LGTPVSAVPLHDYAKIVSFLVGFTVNMQEKEKYFTILVIHQHTGTYWIDAVVAIF